MKHLVSSFALFFLFLCSAHLSFSQWSHDPAVNNAICTATGGQIYSNLINDGSGGTIIVWLDYRGGIGFGIYAQRINTTGTAQWTADGIAICTEVCDDQAPPKIISDGAGGAIIAWADLRNGSDKDIYAQRINASGVVQWTANGIAICTATSDQSTPDMASDGAGGALITWSDQRLVSNYKIYAQRINTSGVVQWAADGVAIGAAANNQQYPIILGNSAGGGISCLDRYPQRQQ